MLSWYILKLLFKKRSISSSVLYLNRLKTVFEIISLPDTGSTPFSSKAGLFREAAVDADIGVADPVKAPPACPPGHLEEFPVL